MQPITELEWTYSPPDFLSPGSIATVVGNVRFADGRASLQLAAPVIPIPPDVFHLAVQVMNDMFLARCVATRRAYRLSDRPNTIQTGEDGTRVISVVATSHIRITSAAPELILKGPDGVIRNTTAEREALEDWTVADLIAKMPLSATLRDICRSYRQAVEDPADEFVHLYEISDRLKRHYGGREEDVIAALNCRTTWKKLGKLTNSAPVSESRHRGLHPSLRPATDAELQEARAMALELIRAYARTL